MARVETVRRVHTAVMTLAERSGPGALTMEGIAAEAGVGKQTLYRNWSSVHAILFDALAAESATPEQSAASSAAEAEVGPSAEDSADATIMDLLRGASAEISTEPRASLLRTLASVIQTDDEVAQQFHVRLLEPQLAQITAVVAANGYANPRGSTELLLAPILYRWFLRLPALGEDELRAHAERVLTLRG